MSEQKAARILIAEDEANLRLVLQKELERLGYRVQVAPDGEAALRKLEESNVDVLLCDINMPRIDGMELLRRVHQRPNPPEVIMLTGQATVETAVEAMKLGAYDYLTKPYSITELDVRVKQAADKRRLRVDNVRLREQLDVSNTAASELYVEHGFTQFRAFVRGKDLPLDGLHVGDGGEVQVLTPNERFEIGQEIASTAAVASGGARFDEGGALPVLA